MNKERHLLTFVHFLSSSSNYQFQCILNTLNPTQIKIVIEICHNILYNNTLTLSKKEKSALQVYKEVYVLISDKKKSRNLKREIISRNYKAIKKVITVVKDLYGWV